MNRLKRPILVLILLTFNLYSFDRIEYDNEYCPKKYLDCTNVFKSNNNIIINNNLKCEKKSIKYLCQGDYYKDETICKKESIKSIKEKGYKLNFKDFNGKSNWKIKDDITVLQTENGNPSFFMYNNQIKIGSEITGKVKIVDGDNDSWGFVFPIEKNKFVLFDWRKSPQSWDGKTAKDGPFISVIKGNFFNMRKYKEISFSREKINKEFEVLKEYGIEEIPWPANEWMDINIKINSDKIIVNVNDYPMIIEEKIKDDIYFGFYNQSQPNVMYYDFKVEDKYEYKCNKEDKTILSKDKKWCEKKAIEKINLEEKSPICNYCKPKTNKVKFIFKEDDKNLNKRIREAQKREKVKKIYNKKIKKLFKSFVKPKMDIRTAIEVLGPPTSTNLLNIDKNLRECHYNNHSIIYDLKNSYYPYKKNSIRTIKVNREVRDSIYFEILEIQKENNRKICENDKKNGYYNSNCK